MCLQVVDDRKLAVHARGADRILAICLPFCPLLLTKATSSADFLIPRIMVVSSRCGEHVEISISVYVYCVHLSLNQRTQPTVHHLAVWSIQLLAGDKNIERAVERWSNAWWAIATWSCLGTTDRDEGDSQ